MLLALVDRVLASKAITRCDVVLDALTLPNFLFFSKLTVLNLMRVSDSSSSRSSPTLNFKIKFIYFVHDIPPPVFQYDLECHYFSRERVGSILVSDRFLLLFVRLRRGHVRLFQDTLP